MGDLKSVLNIDAETGANIIGAEATPVLSISNASTGEALSADKLLVKTPILAANATVAGLRIQGASAASGALISFPTAGSLVSCSTIAFTTGGVAGTYALRVALPSGLFGWIPVMPDGAITAIVV